MAADDKLFLREKSAVIKEACETFNKKTVKNAIDELRQKTWSKAVGELLAVMDENLLNDDYEEVLRCAEMILLGT